MDLLKIIDEGEKYINQCSVNMKLALFPSRMHCQYNYRQTLHK